MRAIRVFAAWLCASFLMCLLYTAHRGFDFREAAIASPLFAAVVTVVWLRKFREDSK
jgi:hypothetical protein